MSVSVVNVPPAHPHPLSRSAEALSNPKPGNRVGMKAKGAYPDVSRVKLAAALGKHISTVSFYLRGRIQMPFDTAVRVAGLIGVGVEELGVEVGKARERWREEEAEGMRNGRPPRRSGGKPGGKRVRTLVRRGKGKGGRKTT